MLANKSNFCLTLQRDYHHHSLVDPETHSYTSGNKEGTSCPSGTYLGTYLPDYLPTKVSIRKVLPNWPRTIMTPGLSQKATLHLHRLQPTTF